MRLGVDLMGGESPPEEYFKAVIQAAGEFSTSDALVVFVTPNVSAQLEYQLKKSSQLINAKIERVEVPEFIEMDESPLMAIRRKKASSLVTGISFVKQGLIEGLVSSGNTGALIAGATLMLPLLPHIDRPALLAVLPTKRGGVAVLDVGGNVSVTAKHLVQFTHMGVAFQQCSLGINSPAVGLLNIGSESIKGTSEVRQAYQFLKDKASSQINFVGNVEGRDVFDGKVDVLVTDGFSGNVFLKTAEGVSSFLIEKIKTVLKDQENNSLDKALIQLDKYSNYEEYPGAVLCGVDGVVVKCHGASTSQGMLNAIRGASSLIKNNLLAKIKSRLLQDIQ